MGVTLQASIPWRHLRLGAQDWAWAWAWAGCMMLAGQACLTGMQPAENIPMSRGLTRCRWGAQYEVAGAQAAARAAMPLAGLRAAAEDAAQLSRDMGDTVPLAVEEVLAVALLDWFKLKFFTWVWHNSRTIPFCSLRVPVPGSTQQRPLLQELHRDRGRD